MLIKNNEENNEYTMFYDTELKITKDLHTFGEIGILKMINDKIKTKSIILENKWCSLDIQLIMEVKCTICLYLKQK